MRRRLSLGGVLVLGAAAAVPGLGGCQAVLGIGGECLEGSPGCGGAGGETGGAGGTGAATTGPTTGGGGTGGTTGSPDCGNGTKEGTEECDDGNKKDADGCEADCTLPRCGNGIVDPGELCFTAPSKQFPTNGEDARDLVIADCDADGDLDIIVSNFPEAALTALRNAGDGTYDEVVKSDCNQEKVGLALSKTGPSTFEVVALFQVSGRTLWFSQDPATPCKFTQTMGTATEAGGLDLVVFDANGNANPDVAKVMPGQNGFYGKLYLSVDHEIAGPPSSSAGATVPSAVAAGDLVGDGGVDLVVTSTADDDLAILENVGGTFTGNATHVPPGGLGKEPVDVQTGDLDGDGVADIVTANRGAGTISVLRNLGAGTFAAQAPEPKVDGDNGVAAAKPLSVALADVNADGFLDAVTANSDDSSGKSSVTVFLNDGTGKLLLARKATFPLVGADAPYEVGRLPQSVKVADVNGDGLPDIVTSNGHVQAGTSAVSVLLSNP